MSEEQANYGDQPAAVIDPPRTVRALSEKGLVNYQAWGWVKMSAKFIAHIRKLKGAKLGVWQVIALSIDETGKCRKTIKEICELTDYSHTEVINSIRELQELGYLTVQKDPKGNIYDPEFVARGELSPSDEVVKKVESTLVYSVESTPAIEKSPSSIKSIKRVNTPKQAVKGVEWAMLEGRKVEKEDFPKALEDEALKAFESAMHCPGSWKWYPGKGSDEAAWKELREAVVAIYQSDGIAGFEGYYTWSIQPYSRGAMTILAIKNNPENFALSWVAYQGSDAYRAKKTDDNRAVYTDDDGIPLT